MKALETVTYAGIPMLGIDKALLSYDEGLIPNEVVFKLRVNDKYRVEQNYNYDTTKMYLY